MFGGGLHEFVDHREAPSLPNLVDVESFGGEWHFIIPPKRGRLHINWQYARGPVQGGDGEAQDFVRLTLTARGPTASDEGVGAVLPGIDLGRATIVKSFERLMTDEANRHWGLKK
jgi:hypothetical protein